VAAPAAEEMEEQGGAQLVPRLLLSTTLKR